MQQVVLAIDDDADIRNMLRTILSQYGYHVITAPDATSGLRSAYRHRPDVIVLDVVLPDMEGFEVCRRLREMAEVPIVLLTGIRTGVDDVLEGLEAGADQYLTKPFDTPELVSRLRLCLRRASSALRGPSRYLVASHSLVLDCGRYEVSVDGRVVPLSPREMELLRLLVQHPRQVISCETILSRVWGADHVPEVKIVQQYVYQLRQKIEPDEATPRYIHTVRGEGYCFHDDSVPP